MSWQDNRRQCHTASVCTAQHRTRHTWLAQLGQQASNSGVVQPFVGQQRRRRLEMPQRALCCQGALWPAVGSRSSIQGVMLGQLAGGLRGAIDSNGSYDVRNPVQTALSVTRMQQSTRAGRRENTSVFRVQDSGPDKCKT